MIGFGDEKQHKKLREIMHPFFLSRCPELVEGSGSELCEWACTSIIITFISPKESLRTGDIHSVNILLIQLLQFLILHQLPVSLFLCHAYTPKKPTALVIILCL